MKLGKKGKDVESFVDKLMAEGESKFPYLTMLSLSVCVVTPYLSCFRSDKCHWSQTDSNSHQDPCPCSARKVRGCGLLDHWGEGVWSPGIGVRGCGLLDHWGEGVWDEGVWCVTHGMRGCGVLLMG